MSEAVAQPAADVRAPGTVLNGAIVGVTLLYLLVELAFNAKLLDVAGGMPSAAELDAIEVRGRLVSAAGASVVVWRLLCARCTPAAAAARLLAVSLLVGPTVYIGQRALVDALVARADNIQRWHAFMAVSLSNGLRMGAVGLQGAKLDEETARSAAGKTFFSVLPLLAYSSGRVLHDVQGQFIAIAKDTARCRLGSTGEAYNRHYVPAVNEIRRQFNDRYLSASRDLGTAGNAPDAEEAWREYLIRVNEQPFTADSATPRQRAAVIAQLRRKGIAVPDDWRLDDRDRFMAAHPARQGMAKFRREADSIIGRSTTIGPGLGWAEFSHHPDVQTLVRRRLKERAPQLVLSGDTLSLDMDSQAFARRVFEGAEKAVASTAAASAMKTRADLLEGRQRETGERALRAVIVPPIALALSLFLGLCNAVGLLVGLASHGAASKLVLRAVLVAAVIGLPMLVDNAISRSGAYLSMRATLAEQYAGTAVALDWLVRAEPMFQPVASGLDRLVSSPEHGR